MYWPYTYPLGLEKSVLDWSWYWDANLVTTSLLADDLATAAVPDLWPTYLFIGNLPIRFHLSSERTYRFLKRGLLLFWKYPFKIKRYNHFQAHIFLFGINCKFSNPILYSCYHSLYRAVVLLQRECRSEITCSFPNTNPTSSSFGWTKGLAYVRTSFHYKRAITSYSGYAC